MNGTIRPFNVLESPFIKVKTEVCMPGGKNGKPVLVEKDKYVVAPSAKKISTYIVNQIFGSELVTQTEGLNINWLMPTLKEALELAIYQEESFIYLHKFDNKVYLECIKKNEIHNLIQKFDKVISGTIIQDIDDIPGDDNRYTLNQRICAFRGYKANGIYLLYVLNRNNYYLEFDDGNGQTNLRKNEVVNCPIPLPPLSLQQEFATKVEAIEQMKAKVRQSLKESEELFNSRMDYYFS